MSSSPSRTTIVQRALRTLLRPLARLLIAEQIPLSSAVEQLKSALVEQAEEAFRLPDKEPTDSRISLLTGVHRKDVKRLRGMEEEDDEREAFSPSLAARLIADWNGIPELLDDEGNPLPLYRSSSRGRPSVRDLVERSGRDIRPQALIDEWVRLGLAAIDEQNRLYLVKDAFVPEHDFDEKAQFFGRNLGEHMAASVHNLRGEDPPMLDQALYYSGLTEESAAQLEARARELSMRALRTLNKEARALQEEERGRDDAVRRIHFGAYFHRASGESEPGDD